MAKVNNTDWWRSFLITFYFLNIFNKTSYSEIILLRKLRPVYITSLSVYQVPKQSRRMWDLHLLYYTDDGSAKVTVWVFSFLDLGQVGNQHKYRAVCHLKLLRISRYIKKGLSLEKGRIISFCIVLSLKPIIYFSESWKFSWQSVKKQSKERCL